MTLLQAVHEAVEKHPLTQADAEEVMRSILAGESTPAMTAALLTALRMKGETVEELAGFARAMRAAATPIPISEASRPLLDTCGTGGGGVPSFNISTAAAFVAAGAGVRVAKHGNRAITSTSGSADVLEALGVRTQATPELVASAIEEVGIGFLFAPAFHGAMRHVQPIRLELKFRTAFNYLGPLTNPARAEMQLVGTGSEAIAEKLAHALVLLGLRSGFVVRGSDGLGEVTVTGPTTVYRIENGHATKLTLEPADFGFALHPHGCIPGGDARHNASIIESVLQGDGGPCREIVVMNAALALVAAGKAAHYREAADLASKSIDTGAAMHKRHALAQHMAITRRTESE